MTRARYLFSLDLILLLSVAVLQEPRRTSIAGHEWLGAAFSALIVVHILVNWRWIITTLRRIRSTEPRRSRINAVLNGALFVVMVITVLSGMAISEVLLPLLGIARSDHFAWMKIHGFFAGTSLANACSPVLQSAPEVPPARSPQAAPAPARTACAPAPAAHSSLAACTAAVAPRTIPVP